MSYISDIVPVDTDCGVWMRSLTTYAEKCLLVQNYTDCRSTGFIQYSYFIFCLMPEDSYWIGLIPLLLLLAVLFIGLSTAADSFFCPCISVIVDHLHLSHNIAGVTFLAFGNGAPDIFASLASVLNSENPAGLAFGALLGAGMFLSTIIVATITLIKPFEVMQRPLLRDLIFYLFTLYWLFYLLYKRRIRLIDSVGFLVLYVIYVLVVVGGRYVRKRLQSRARVEAQRNQGTPLDEQERQRRKSIADAEAENNHRHHQTLETDDEESNKYDLFFGSNRSRADRNANNNASQVNDDILTADSVSIAASDVGLLDIRMSNGRSFIKSLLASISPFTSEEWRYSSIPNRFQLVLKTPFLILMKLTIPVVDLDSNWSSCLPLVLVQCFICPIFALCALKYIDYYISGIFPVALIALVSGFVAVAVLMAFTYCRSSSSSKSSTDENNDENTRNRQTPPASYYRVFFAYFGFVMAVIWIYCIAREVVNILRTVGVVLNLSHEILGLTVLAWSNSLGDLVADVTVATQGYPRMAISACFGGPLFNMLVGVGLPFTIAVLREGNIGGNNLSIVTSPVAQVLCLFLAISLISSFVILPLSRFRATRFYAVYLIFLYVTFLIVAILTEMGIINSLW